MWIFILILFQTTSAINTFQKDDVLTAERINELVAAINRLQVDRGKIPIGTIIAYAGNILPDDTWKWCDGGPIPAGPEYDGLRNILGNAYGANQLPNLKGRVLVGFIDPTQIGGTFGNEKIVLTPDQIPQHRHEVVVYGDGPNSNEIAVQQKAGGTVRGKYTETNPSPGTAVDVRQPSLVIGYIIKVK